MNGFVVVDTLTGNCVLSLMLTRGFGLSCLPKDAPEKVAAPNLCALCYSLVLRSANLTHSMDVSPACPNTDLEGTDSSMDASQTGLQPRNCDTSGAMTLESAIASLERAGHARMARVNVCPVREFSTAASKSANLHFFADATCPLMVVTSSEGGAGAALGASVAEDVMQLLVDSGAALKYLRFAAAAAAAAAPTRNVFGAKKAQRPNLRKALMADIRRLYAAAIQRQLRRSSQAAFCDAAEVAEWSVTIVTAAATVAGGANGTEDEGEEEEEDLRDLLLSVHRPAASPLLATSHIVVSGRSSALGPEFRLGGTGVHAGVPSDVAPPANEVQDPVADDELSAEDSATPRSRRGRRRASAATTHSLTSASLDGPRSAVSDDDNGRHLQRALDSLCDVAALSHSLLGEPTGAAVKNRALKTAKGTTSSGAALHGDDASPPPLVARPWMRSSLSTAAGESLEVWLGRTVGVVVTLRSSGSATLADDLAAAASRFVVSQLPLWHSYAVLWRDNDLGCPEHDEMSAAERVQRLP